MRVEEGEDWEEHEDDDESEEVPDKGKEETRMRRNMQISLPHVILPQVFSHQRRFRVRLPWSFGPGAVVSVKAPCFRTTD